jgi:hypothetical protein
MVTGSDMLFDRICRENGIIHRLTQPATPTTTGKVDRFHQTLRRELLDDAAPFPDLVAAQAAVDGFRTEYNTRHPHQSLGMAFAADRFTPNRDGEEVLPLRLPVSLTAAVPAQAGPPAAETDPTATTEPVEPVPAVYSGGPVEFERVVPPSGNLQVCGKQFWPSPARSGITVTFWASVDAIHLLIGGGRVKTVRSHVSVTDLAILARDGGRPAGPALLPLDSDSPALVVEVDRVVSGGGTVSLGHHVVLAAEILGGWQVGVRIDPQTLTFFDLDTRELLRTRPNPLTPAQIAWLHGARPPGPPPQPPIGPVAVQRRASSTGVIMVVGQKIALGRVHARKTVTVEVTDTTLRCSDLEYADEITLDRGMRGVPGALARQPATDQCGPPRRWGACRRSLSRSAESALCQSTVQHQRGASCLRWPSPAESPRLWY